MRKNQRVLSTIFALALAIPLTISWGSKTADAKSQMKSFYIPTVLTSKTEDSDGDRATITENRVFTDEGLYTGRTISEAKGGLDNSYSVTKRDGKGRVLKEQQYDNNGLEGTYSYSYWNNGRVKKTVYKKKGSKDYQKWNFNKKGFVTSCVSTDGKEKRICTYKYKFNKKGDPTSIKVNVKTSVGSKKAATIRTVETKIKNTYLKKGKNKGKLSKQVSSEYLSKYNTSSTKNTTTIRNKYDNKGRLIQKSTYSKRVDSDGDTYWDKDVTTYTYKTATAPGKYWKICKYAADETIFMQMGIEEKYFY